MPFRNLPDSDLKYCLISFDKNGTEQPKDPDADGRPMSEKVIEILEQEPITDVFIFSHGWLNDIPRATESYNDWIGAVVGSEEHLQAMHARPQGFQPLLIGFHWPSLPFGDHDISNGVSFAADSGASLDQVLEQAADGIAETERAKQALQTILDSAMEDMAPDEMPPEVVEAYETLWEEAGLGLNGPTGGPGSEGDNFDPELIYQDALDEETSFAGGVLGPLLKGLGLTSFWTMKKRARQIGEQGAGELLRTLQKKTSPDVAFHLMGHSFGCIVVSATVAGAGGDTPLPRPINTLFMAQGALSCWAFTPEIPIAAGKPGYFRSIHHGKVAGAWVTTQSLYDTAVGRQYPLVTSKRNVSFAPGKAPRADGALGAFGVQGPGFKLVDLAMQPTGTEYGFEPGTVYNLEGSDFIKDHSDLAKPEVAHAFWSAVRTGA